ncbi:SDR family oxidoreductase [Entomobacter blattae]|uniref:NAD(P)-dependent oxidoreductase n=1 Tax=Entomobacter blattae TaxID=2762277 RepID=A0A7H1NUW7_9PROT|nr:SDR family oxidoreductase [Entomobacter blattae]QNT79577.1 hypothetical protein JGUZn3_23770 [Entomobacter blattae]
MKNLFIFGLGYSARRTAALCSRHGFYVKGTVRTLPRYYGDFVTPVAFEQAGAFLQDCTHLLVSIPPIGEQDVVLAHYGKTIEQASKLEWIGYYSTIGVYGDHDGGWVDETTPPCKETPRNKVRLAIEEQWMALGQRLQRRARKNYPRVDIFRLGGIYGPGRSVFDRIKANRVLNVYKPGHYFNHIHVEDIALASFVALTSQESDIRVLNCVDGHPLEQRLVIEQAYRCLQQQPPQPLAFSKALPLMTPLQRAFWHSNKRVSSEYIQKRLNIKWQYPSLLEGLKVIFRQENKPNSF